MPLSVTFLLPEPELGGGTLVVLQLAELARGLGHRVTVSGLGPLGPELEFRGRYLDRTREPLPGAQDLWVATFWTTVAEASDRGLEPLVHFCQGFEGEIPHFASDQDRIERVYRRRLPTLAVSPRLVEKISNRYDRPVRLLPPALPDGVRRRSSWTLFLRHRPRRPARVALFGAFRAEVKGVELGLRALRVLETLGVPATLHRVSILPVEPEEEALFPCTTCASRIPPRQAQELLARCDLLLFPVAPEEGFGLPMLEAMALGVPVVAGRTPTTEFVAGEGGARLVAREPEALARAARELLTNPKEWRSLRWRGRRAAARFGAEATRYRLQEALVWATTCSSSFPA